MPAKERFRVYDKIDNNPNTNWEKKANDFTLSMKKAATIANWVNQGILIEYVSFDELKIQA